jgi:hypothetical protein
MTEVVYNVAKARFTNGSLDWDTTDIRVLAIGVNATTPSQQRDPDLDTVSQLLALAGIAEATGTGYARKTTVRTVTEDDANDRANLDANTVTYTGANGWTAQAFVFYEEGGGTDATRNLISYHDTGLPFVMNGGDFTINTPNDVIRAT